MLKCHFCSSTGETRTMGNGLISTCAPCGRTSVTLNHLLAISDRDLVLNFWEFFRWSNGWDRAMPCPRCSDPMSEVQMDLKGSLHLLYACDGCYMINLGNDLLAQFKASKPKELSNERDVPRFVRRGRTEEDALSKAGRTVQETFQDSGRLVGALLRSKNRRINRAALCALATAFALGFIIDSGMLPAIGFASAIAFVFYRLAVNESEKFAQTQARRATGSGVPARTDGAAPPSEARRVA